MSGPSSVLFVDDEQLLLDGLRRALRPLQEDWDCEFAGGGGQALERMAARSFDVVVSDMLMPAMNGVELLTEISKRHPETVRLVLSDSGHPAGTDPVLRQDEDFLGQRGLTARIPVWRERISKLESRQKS